MKPISVLFLLLLTLDACRNHSVEKPVWLNEDSVLTVPGSRLQFKGITGSWQACLLSFSQPIALAVQATETGFSVTFNAPGGVLEGPAQLCIWLNDQRFYYPVTLRNRATPVVIQRDYRSPKTVNPDSSLVQQAIREAIDPYRNLVPVPGKSMPGKSMLGTANYFGENNLALAPKVATYRAIRNEAISSYYVQPGSCTRIPIQSTYRVETNSYFVRAGPLTDVYANTVADGTRVYFVYTGGPDTYRMEATVLNGYATALIPTDKQLSYQLTARIANTVSKTINLIP